MSWTDRARETIRKVHATLPEDISFTARRKAIRAAYPFGERRYWPYKGWLKAQREYLRKHDPKTPAPPLVREMLKDKVKAGDICFPFADEIHENKGGEQ
ncbi:hypothetical protein [Sphingobium sp. Cam5-1]|uniref:hypothetical protein n=1 Tax=Sphingobium sp. Cam5-1 TaxID=2789327 RepID=UPI0018AD29C7|nr:hypothetical protein [Sphingobium sp. Cam5-1]QPI73888.1 hypothetical protein IZV00_05330 [Sphingobium sp. Cam5-1]